MREHPFWDANHRTSYLLALAIMACFDKYVQATAVEAWEAIAAIDRQAGTVSDIQKWLEDRLIPLSPVLPRKSD